MYHNNNNKDKMCFILLQFTLILFVGKQQTQIKYFSHTSLILRKKNNKKKKTARCLCKHLRGFKPKMQPGYFLVLGWFERKTNPGFLDRVFS